MDASMDMIHSFGDTGFVKLTQEQTHKLHNEDMTMLDLAMSNPFSVPPHLILRSIAWLRDKELSVKRKTKEKLQELYHCYCHKLYERRKVKRFVDHLERIPSSLIAYTIDEDCDEYTKILNVECFIMEELFSNSIPSDRVTYHWMKFFLYMPLSQRSYLESIIPGKERFQKEMRNYMRLRKEEKENFSKDVQKKINNSLLEMSKFFINPGEALKGFIELHQMNNAELFYHLSLLLLIQTDFDVCRSFRRSILAQFGDGHLSYGFLKELLVRCSYSIFCYDHVSEISQILRSHIVDKQAKYRYMRLLYTFDIPCAIDLLSMIFDMYPESVNLVKNSFLKLYSVEAGTYTELLLQMLARLGDRLPIKFSDFNLTPILEKGSPSVSFYAINASRSMGASIAPYDEKMQAFEPFSEDMDIWNQAISEPFTASISLILEAKILMKDKKISVRRKTKEKLLELYHSYCLKLCEIDYLNQSVDHIEWIPSILIAYAIHKDCENFGTLNVELLLSEELFPDSIKLDQVLCHWVRFFLYMPASQRRFLESIILEKKRFQKKLKNYLKIRDNEKRNFSEAMPKKICYSFLNMSRFFGDFSEAVNNFYMLHQVNDNLLFSELSQLLHKDTGFENSRLYRRSILARIGDKHHLQGFLKMLLVRCSYSIVDHIKYFHLLLTNGSIGKVERNTLLEKSAIDVCNMIHHILAGVQSHDGKVENVKFDQDTSCQHRDESSLHGVNNISFSLTAR